MDLAIGFVSPNHTGRASCAAFCRISYKIYKNNNALRSRFYPTQTIRSPLNPFHGKTCRPTLNRLTVGPIELKDGPRPTLATELRMEHDPDQPTQAQDCPLPSPSAGETWPSESNSPVSVCVAHDPGEPPTPTVDVSALQPPAEEASGPLQPPLAVSVSCATAEADATIVTKLFRPTKFDTESDARAYDRLLERIAAVVQVNDVIDQVLVQQFVLLVWEASRLRSPYLALSGEIDQLAPQSHNWPQLSKRLPQLAQINQLTANIEARQFALLREIERHRATRAQRLRTAVDRVDDAEFTVLDH